MTWLARLATRPVLGHDMAHCAPRHGTVHARPGHSARSLGAPCAQPRSVGCALVHPTQFWTQCTVSVTVWTTIHEHCSQEKKIKSNQIKSNGIKSFKMEFSKIKFLLLKNDLMWKLLSCISYECKDIVYEIFFCIRIVSRGCVLCLRDTALEF